MNILLVGPAHVKDPQGDEILTAYKNIIEASTKDADQEIFLSTTLLDEILIEVTTNDLRMFDSRNQRDLSTYDVLLMRGRGIGRYVDIMGAMTLYAKKHGIKMINEYSVVRDPSKLLQNVHFHFNGMNIPRTLFVNRGLFMHKEWAQWHFPCVMKLVNGSLGNNNFVVNDWDEVEEIYNRNLENKFILQEFIPNEGDYRLLIAGSKTLTFKRISNDGSHLNNTSHGGSAELVNENEIPSYIFDQARLISRQYGMSLSGVDVMQNSETGEYYFLEVNMQPQLSTGALLEEKQALLGEFLKSLVHER